MDVGRFEWDLDKEVANLAKHGVSFVEAQLAFLDARRVIFEDAAHSETETRFFSVGRTNNGILTVRFTPREETIRIIGAGYWRKGRVIYERQSALHR